MFDKYRHPLLAETVAALLFFVALVWAVVLGAHLSTVLYPDAPDYGKICESKGGQWYPKAGGCYKGKEWINVE